MYSQKIDTNKMEIINYHLTSFGTSLSGTDSIIAGSFEDIFYCFFFPFLSAFLPAALLLQQK